MLRHKAFIQTARIAYALSDVVDDDEASHYADPVDYSVRETLPAPEKKQPRRRPPREVMADPITIAESPAPPEAEPEENPPSDEKPDPRPMEELRREFEALWKEWNEVRRHLDAPSLAKIRKDSGCELVDKSISLEQLKKVLAMAEELKI